eukprot:SAG31_NODE_405_length_16084_cov_3.913982_10_plen_204_part_00
MQSNPQAKRAQFFLDVRGCRRRKQVSIEKTTLGQLINTADEFELLECRSTIIRVRELLQQKGILALDGFNLFNRSRSGLLSCSELNAGFWWLGLKLPPEQIHSIVRAIDQDKDGLVSLSDFLAAFQVDASGSEGVPTSVNPSAFRNTPNLATITIEPRDIQELHNSDAVRQLGTGLALELLDIPDEAIRHVQARVVVQVRNIV